MLSTHVIVYIITPLGVRKEKGLVAPLRSPNKISAVQSQLRYPRDLLATGYCPRPSLGCEPQVSRYCH